MKVETRYSEDEIKAIIMAAHEAVFGDPPAGQEWVIEIMYSGKCEIISRKIESETAETDKVAE